MIRTRFPRRAPKHAPTVFPYNDPVAAKVEMSGPALLFGHVITTTGHDDEGERSINLTVQQNGMTVTFPLADLDELADDVRAAAAFLAGEDDTA